MADTTPSTTQTPGTDVNLNLNFDDIKIPEAPATAPDLKIDFSDVQQPEAKTAEVVTPETPAPEANTTQAEALPSEEVKPVVETPVPAKDDRLAQEDKIVEKKIEEKVEAVVPQSEEAKTPEATTQEVVVTAENTPVVMEANLPTTSLKEDQKIIDELTNMADTNTTVEINTPVVEEVKPVVEEVKTEIQEPVVNTTAPAPTAGMDLDALLGTPSTPATEMSPEPVGVVNEVIVAPVVMPTPVEAIPQAIPGSTFQTGLPPIVNPVIQMANAIPTITNNTNPSSPAEPQHFSPAKGKSKKLTTFLLLVILGGVAAYVLKTMYPLEYENMKANVTSLFGGETTITENAGGIEDMLSATGEVATGWFLTGAVETTGETITGTAPTGDLSTPGFDGFADLQDVLTGSNSNPVLTDQQLTQLKKFSDEAKTFVELGKKINDKVMLKYGTYVSKKADGLILSIENKEQIDNAKVDGYLAQFSGYLHQLTTLSYDGLNTPTEPAVTPEETNTPTSGENDTNSGMIQDINRDTPQDTGQTTEIPGV